MAEDTKIQWATHTWNPWIGCSHAHTGCDNCYAEAMAKRLGVSWGPEGQRRRTSDTYWRQPLKWEREAAKAGQRSRIFPSLCDPFEDWPHLIRHHTGPQLTLRDGAYSPGATGDGFRLATMDDLRRDMFALIDETPHLDWLLLTKRPDSVRRMWPVWDEDAPDGLPGKPATLENVWLIYSASDQETLEAGLPHLLACRDLVPVLGLSLEPLVGPVDLTAVQAPNRWPGKRENSRINALGGYSFSRREPFTLNGIPEECGEVGYVDTTFQALDWVIVGGESGPHARPCNIDWIRSIRNQCAEAGVPCFVKQLGARPVMDYYGEEGLRERCLESDARVFEPTRDGWAQWDWRRDKYQPRPGTVLEIPLRDRKGGDPAEWPEDLRVRQFPAR